MTTVYYLQTQIIGSGLNESKSFQAVLKSIQYGVERAASMHGVTTDTIHQWRSELGLNKQGEKK